jgi:signal recognition particle receptor subunit beta
MKRRLNFLGFDSDEGLCKNWKKQIRFMAFVNYTTKNIAIKIVYYGPGLSGKTTNLRFIYSKMDPDSRGDLLCLETPLERTIFFDLLPIKAGLIHDFRVHFQLMTVPGQVFYEASRRSVLKGADGIVFVADSQIPLLDANLENFDGLRRNLVDFNVDLNFMPLVFQYNKRDLDSLIPVETFNSLLNPLNLPFIESSAVNGKGVFETLKQIAKMTVPVVREKIFGEKKEPQKEEKEKREEAVRKAKEKRQEVKMEREKEKKDIEFVSEKKDPQIRLTKIKFQSQTDIEDQVDKLAQEFLKK